VVAHGHGVETLYGHLDALAVSVGDAVVVGQVIGFEGSTGFSTGPHLHFEVRVNGQFVDPLLYF
jgi:murein DD-endopeptidase MepM/ murein hydrolase activator NlpD